MASTDMHRRPMCRLPNGGRCFLLVTDSDLEGTGLMASTDAFLLPMCRLPNGGRCFLLVTDSGPEDGARSHRYILARWLSLLLHVQGKEAAAVVVPIIGKDGDPSGPA